MSGLQVATHFTHIKLDIIVNFISSVKSHSFDYSCNSIYNGYASTQKAADERKKKFFIDRKKLVIYIISLRKCLFLIDIFDVKRKNVYY